MNDNDLILGMMIQNLEGREAARKRFAQAKVAKNTFEDTREKVAAKTRQRELLRQIQLNLEDPSHELPDIPEDELYSLIEQAAGDLIPGGAMVGSTAGVRRIRNQLFKNPDTANLTKLERTELARNAMSESNAVNLGWKGYYGRRLPDNLHYEVAEKSPRSETFQGEQGTRLQWLNSTVDDSVRDSLSRTPDHPKATLARLYTKGVPKSEASRVKFHELGHSHSFNEFRNHTLVTRSGSRTPVFSELVELYKNKRLNAGLYAEDVALGRTASHWAGLNKELIEQLKAVRVAEKQGGRVLPLLKQHEEDAWANLAEEWIAESYSRFARGLPADTRLEQLFTEFPDSYYNQVKKAIDRGETLSPKVFAEHPTLYPLYKKWAIKNGVKKEMVGPTWSKHRKAYLDSSPDIWSIKDSLMRPETSRKLGKGRKSNVGK